MRPRGFNVSAIASGSHLGGFVLLTDADGIRHALRLGAVLALSDGDPCHDSTMVQMPAGRTLLIHTPLEKVITWFS